MIWWLLLTFTDPQALRELAHACSLYLSCPSIYLHLPSPTLHPHMSSSSASKKADSFLSWGLHMSPFPRPYLLKHLLHHSTFCSNVTTSKRFSLLDYCSTKIPHITMSFLLYPILFPFLSLISNLNCHSLFL